MISVFHFPVGLSTTTVSVKPARVQSLARMWSWFDAGTENLDSVKELQHTCSRKRYVEQSLHSTQNDLMSFLFLFVVVVVICSFHG